MKEEIVANAELVGDDLEVVAALELPQNLMRRPKLTLRPTYETLRKLSHFSKLRLRIEQRVNGTLVRKVDVEECWLLNAECRHWSETIKDCQVETDPRGIRITEWREYQAAYPVVTFWLSGNRVLRPSCIDNRFESGDRQVGVVAAYVMRLPEAFVLHNNHYWWSAEDGVVSVSSNLVARNVKALSEESMPSEGELLKRVDDWLLLASLATRRRTVCVGWSKIDQEKFVRCYRGDISVPVNDSTATDDELISPDLVQRFLDQSIAKIVDGDPSADAMRRLISAVVPVSKSTVEEDLLTLFSALEEVLLTFRREAGLEFSLDPQRWIDLRKLIKNVVRDSVEDKRAREQIYEKMPELNRVSAAYVFNRYVDQYGIDLNGLWPIFDRSGGISVYEIRNWLAHGVKLSGDATGHLWVVNSHLRWLLERIALNFFGWNLGSDVEERRLAGYVAYCEFVNVRREMTAFMNEKRSV